MYCFYIFFCHVLKITFLDRPSCHLNSGVYLRKSVEKRFPLKMRDVRAFRYPVSVLLHSNAFSSNVRLNSNTTFFFRQPRRSLAGHLVCAFQTPTHLNTIMDYAEGGTLRDVLEYQSRILNGGPLRSSVRFTGVALKDSNVGTFCLS
jgi:hypothetical protein